MVISMLLRGFCLLIVSQDVCYCSSPAEQQQYGKLEVRQSASFGITAVRLSRYHQSYAGVLPGFPFPLLLVTSAPLDKRWLALYNAVQGKYLPKSRWLSKPCLSSMEVVIDDFCLLHLKCCIYTGFLSLLLDSFFRDLCPDF